MSDHLLPEQIEHYNRRLLSPGELLAAGEHVFACDVCRQKLREDRRVGEAITFLQEDLGTKTQYHLEYEQIEGLVDRSLDEVNREIVESHLQLCATCREEVQDLSEFKATLATSKTSAPVIRRPLRGRLAAFFHPQAGPKRWRLASVAAVAVILFGVAVVWIVWRGTGTPSEVASSEPTQSPASKDTAGQVVGASEEPTPSPTGEPALLVELNDGGSRVTLNDQGQATGLESLSQSDQRLVTLALTSKRVEVAPGLTELAGRAETLLGESQEGVPFPLVTPVGTVVESNRPVFSWRALDGADSYVVHVYDSNLNEVFASGSLSATQWQLSGALPRGGVYMWQVTATRNGEEVVSPVAPAPEAKFKVLDGSEVARLANARRNYSKSHLTLGVLYARAGLLNEARREFQALVKANPNSAVARSLLQSIRAR